MKNQIATFALLALMLAGCAQQQQTNNVSATPDEVALAEKEQSEAQDAELAESRRVAEQSKKNKKKK